MSESTVTPSPSPPITASCVWCPVRTQVVWQHLGCGFPLVLTLLQHYEKMWYKDSTPYQDIQQGSNDVCTHCKFSLIGTESSIVIKSYSTYTYQIAVQLTKGTCSLITTVTTCTVSTDCKYSQYQMSRANTLGKSYVCTRTLCTDLSVYCEQCIHSPCKIHKQCAG